MEPGSNVQRSVERGERRGEAFDSLCVEETVVWEGEGEASQPALPRQAGMALSLGWNLSRAPRVFR